jgi:AcrR family transcriptional regulator
LDSVGVTVRKDRLRKPVAAYHHGDLRRALVEAAALSIGEQGVDALKVSELAARLGVTVGAPFRHFESRLALLVAVAEEGARRLIGRMGVAAAQETVPLEQQRARGIAYVRFAVEECGYFRAMTHAEVYAASNFLQEVSAASDQMLDAVLGRVKGTGAARVVRRSAGLLAAQALTYGLARMITDGLLGEIDADQAERLAYEVTGVLRTGVARDGS